MTMEDLRLEGKAGRLGQLMTAVVVDGRRGKEYRLPTKQEIQNVIEPKDEIERMYSEIPFGVPYEPLPSKEALGFRVPLYGFDQWAKLFINRQLLALGTLVKLSRKCIKNTQKRMSRRVRLIQGDRLLLDFYCPH